MKKHQIYLDNNGTTQLDPRIIPHLLPLLNHPYNPSSVHSFGQKAKQLVTDARTKIARFLGVRPDEIFFTSGGTEALTTLISHYGKGHTISSPIEHSAVYEHVKNGTLLPVGPHGAPSPDDLREALRPDTSLIALSAANSETGVLLDLERCAEIASMAQVPLVVDGVALLGKAPVTIPRGVTAMVFSGHKIHALQGIGIFFLRKGERLTPLIRGGGQERGMRSGTENLPGIVSLGYAIELISEESIRRMASLRDYFEKELLRRFPGASVNGTGTRTANTSNIFFPAVDGETLLIQLDMAGVMASQGSACSAGAQEPSRVLLSMGLGKERALSSIRFSLSRFTTREELDMVIHLLEHQMGGGLQLPPPQQQALLQP